MASIFDKIFTMTKEKLEELLEETEELEEDAIRDDDMDARDRAERLRKLVQQALREK